MITNFQKNLKPKCEILSLTSTLRSLLILSQLRGNFIPGSGPGRTGQAARPLKSAFSGLPFIVRIQFPLERKNSKKPVPGFQAKCSSLLPTAMNLRIQEPAFHHSNFAFLFCNICLEPFSSTSFFQEQRIYYQIYRFLKPEDVNNLE